MENLPVEIIEKILINEEISISDLLRLSLVSSKLHQIISDNHTIWKQKLLQKWPVLETVLGNEQVNFYYEIRYIYELRKRVRTMLDKMVPKFYNKIELSETDLKDFGLLLQERKVVYNYLVLDLKEIIITNGLIDTIEVVPLRTPGNLTLKYYAAKILRYIRQIHLSKMWENFISLPQEKQILETGAAFVAQWCQPNIEIYPEKISKEMDKIAEKVKATLLDINPKHPLFNATPKLLELWKVEIRPENEWNANDCRQIITTLRDVLFNGMGFVGYSHVASCTPDEYYINLVLKTKRGLSITLAIVFEAIARRLGLRCEPVLFPSHFLLRFCESNLPESDWYYIDVFNGGQIVRRGACPHSRSTGIRSTVPMATSVQIIEQMATNIKTLTSSRPTPILTERITAIRSCLEMLKVIKPKDISTLETLASLYIYRNMDTRPLEYILLSQEWEDPEQVQRIVNTLRDYQAQNDFEEKPIKPIQRKDDTKYAVGMVMYHKTNLYRCVICDWDHVCSAEDHWRSNNNVDRLELKGNQPFYNVLADDGTYRYAAQENLLPEYVNHPLKLIDEVGRHFSHFYKSHYVPNGEKEKHYPADKEVRHKYHHDLEFVVR